MPDLTPLRTDTPGARDAAHFNNAGAALMPRIVLDTVFRHMRQEAHLGGFEAAESAGERLEQVYASVAHLINVHPGEIAVIENATRAWDMAGRIDGNRAGTRGPSSEGLSYCEATRLIHPVDNAWPASSQPLQPRRCPGCAG